MRCVNHRGGGYGWLKFNFRGVGKSGEIFRWTGEEEDAWRHTFGERQERIDPEKIGICGYSFGSKIALAAAVADRESSGRRHFPFIQPADLLNRYVRPKLFVTGAWMSLSMPQIWKNKYIVCRTQRARHLPGRRSFLDKRRRFHGGKSGQFFQKSFGL